MLGPDNRAISADYPGYLSRRIERELPGAVCLFVQGGAGDINPYLDKQPVNQGAFEEAEKMGNALADRALRVARSLKPMAKNEGSIAVSSEVLSFRDRWSPTKTLRAGLTRILIDRDIAIATLPGEPFVDSRSRYATSPRFRTPSSSDTHTALVGNGSGICLRFALPVKVDMARVTTQISKLVPAKRSSIAPSSASSHLWASSIAFPVLRSYATVRTDSFHRDPQSLE